MQDDEQCRLYALALSLIPDPDAADDLCMEARGEADLRRRASAWRRRHGLPPKELAGPPDPAGLPALDEVERAFALHLARRARRRRRARAAFACLLALSLLLAAAPRVLPALRSVIATTQAMAPDELTANPAFAARPVASAPGPGRTALSVYRAEATPGSVTLWWDLQGPDAARLGQSAVVALLVSDDQEIEATSHVAASPRHDRYLARTAFRLPILDQTLVFLTVRTAGDPPRLLKVSVEPKGDPAARTFAVDRKIEAPAAGVTVTIQSITLAADYTAIRLRSDSGGTNNLILGYSMEAYTDGSRLPEYGLWQRLGNNQRVTVFAPLPPGAGSLTLQFPRLAAQAAGSHLFSNDLPPGGQLRTVVIQGPAQSEAPPEIQVALP